MLVSKRKGKRPSVIKTAPGRDRQEETETRELNKIWWIRKSSYYYRLM